MGMDAAQLQQAQAQYLSLVGSTVRSANKTLTLAALGDPLWREALGPVLTWATIVWKATTSSDYKMVVTVPELGRLAGPVMRRAPRTWGEVKGPLGAAVMSLKRIGWHFDNCMTLVPSEGLRLALPSTSPALVAYHLQIAWKCKLGQDAARRLGYTAAQLDPTAFQRIQRSCRQGQAFPLLRAFITQSIWSTSRLRAVGYDVDASCPYCGCE